MDRRHITLIYKIFLVVLFLIPSNSSFAQMGYQSRYNQFKIFHWSSPVSHQKFIDALRSSVGPGLVITTLDGSENVASSQQVGMILPQDDKTPAEAILTNGQLRCNGAFVRANGIWVMPAVHEYQIVYCAFDTQAGLELDVYATSTPIPGGPFGTFHLMSLGANSGLNTTAEALTEKSVQKVTLGLSSLLMQSPAELSNREAGSQSLATQSGDRSLPPQSGTDRPSSLNPNNGGQELWNGFRAGMSRADASSWVGKLAVSNPEYRINIDERNTFKVTGVKVLNKNVTAVLFFGKNDSLKAVSLLTGLPEDTVISHLSAKYGQPTRCSQAAGNVGGGTVCDWVVGALLIRYNWDGGYSQINYSSSTEDSGL